jgi:hypothetical protein
VGRQIDAVGARLQTIMAFPVAAPGTLEKDVSAHCSTTTSIK